jgi:uncharacterized damage-inducible protein DinB
MFRKIEDFLENWQNETVATLKLYKHITDEALLQQVNGSNRDILALLRHINYTVTELPNTAGLPIMINENVLHNMDEIIAHYEKDAKQLATVVKESWRDESLTEEIPMYGSRWTKGTTLLILIMHQTHHRGQLTILMRQAGLMVSGIYGPTKEGWAAMGMEAAQ